MTDNSIRNMINEIKNDKPNLRINTSIIKANQEAFSMPLTARDIKLFGYGEDSLMASRWSMRGVIGDNIIIVYSGNNSHGDYSSNNILTIVQLKVIIES